MRGDHYTPPQAAYTSSFEYVLANLLITIQSAVRERDITAYTSLVWHMSSLLTNWWDATYKRKRAQILDRFEEKKKELYDHYNPRIARADSVTAKQLAEEKHYELQRIEEEMANELLALNMGILSANNILAPMLRRAATVGGKD